jgi:D-serine deaminase-like pyridoxal phosphate-dependent protein
MIDTGRIAQKVVATVISYYPGRAEGGGDEAVCDAGAIAMSKDVGPMKGHGQVVGKPWMLRGVSQEHGVLMQTGETEEKLKLGEMIEIIGQHACLIAAAFPWFYIVDSDMEGGARKVVDVWVPCKGW